MHDDLAALSRDDALALERCEEAARALARCARELRDVGLCRLDEDVVVAGALALPRGDEVEQDPGHPSRDRLERLVREALVRRAHAVCHRLEHLHGNVRVRHQQAPDVACEQRYRRRLLERLRARGAPLPAEHRQLAEHVAPA